jgi:MacB-like periplasmic core domain
MSLPENSTRTMHLAALRCAALMVPTRQRTEWLLEWTSELWYVHQSCIPSRTLSWQGERDVAAFCLGAFNDAMCLRHSALRSSKLSPLHSAAQCTLFLTILAAAAWCLALLLPGVRTAVQPSPYRDPHNLVAISANNYSETSLPTIRADQYRSWRNRTQHLFTDFAFYQPAIKLLHIGPHNTPQLSVARASSNLFDLLGIPLTFATQPSRDGIPSLILSEKLWRTAFNGDPEVVGRTLKLGLRPVRIAGILPSASWQLPGKVDAWLLERDDRIAAISATTRGYVIARRDPSASQTPTSGTWRLYIPQPDGTPASFDCVSLADRFPDPSGIFLFTLFLALLALPATTSLPLGEYPAKPHTLRWSIKLRRWIFLWSKLALILPVVYFGSLDLAHFSTSITAEASQYLQGISSFCALLFAFRWILRDQRRRCPVCLRLLTNPARVGQPSRNFLAWNGTELICTGGHGLLHVPEIATSWFSTQRWLYLDPSWKGLFSDAAAASAGLF